MNWRPHDWEIPGEVEDKSFERGADAMLKAMTEQVGKQVLFPPVTHQTAPLWMDEIPQELRDRICQTLLDEKIVKEIFHPVEN